MLLYWVQMMAFVSVSSLIMGVAASGVSTHIILVTGIAGLVSGALSMAAGEYVSVQSQSDIEKADLRNEKTHYSRTQTTNWMN